MSEKEVLSRYLPPRAVDRVLQWIREHRIHFRISKSRRTKLGDYRPPIRHTNHRISINHDLNPYSFLITFVHELAHLRIFEKYRTSVLPHGKEWKEEFRELMQIFLDDHIFPKEIEDVLKKSIRQSKASSTSDIALSRALSAYDQVTAKHKIEELETGAVFRTNNGRKFRKGAKIRTRYKCLNLQNNRYYLFNPLTPVEPV
jgi:hypothetical protein